MTAPINGTQGYAAQAAQLTIDYENLKFAEVHSATRHLFPTTPSRIIDIGAGTGRDAAALAEQGHRVLAVEPTAELRRHGQNIHRSPLITWLDDGLPDLPRTLARNERFDLILLTAVWMHLDAAERARAMQAVAQLLAPNGQVVITLRHGPIPAGRRMFDVTHQETAALAQQLGLQSIFVTDYADMRNRPGVHWTAIALRNAVAKL
jgi:SAM-dependent methyltransferase